MAEVGASSECQSGRMYRPTQRERAERDQCRPRLRPHPSKTMASLMSSGSSTVCIGEESNAARLILSWKCLARGRGGLEV